MREDEGGGAKRSDQRYQSTNVLGGVIEKDVWGRRIEKHCKVRIKLRARDKA